MQHLNETLGGFIIVVGVVAIVYIVARYNYLIKKAAYESGVRLPSANQKFRLLNLGLILLGLGIGLAVSSIFTFFDLKEDTLDLLIWATIVIFGSLGVLAAHFIKKSLDH